MIAGVLLLVWGVGLLVLFTGYLPAELQPSTHLLATTGLALVSLYAFWFLGWRLRAHLLSDRLGRTLDDLELSLLEVAFGIGCVTLAMFVLGVLGLYSSTAAWVLLGLSLLGAQHRFLADVRRRVVSSGAAHASSSSWAGVIAKWLIVVALAMTLATSLAPSTSQDALVYHLAIPAKYVESGGLHFVEGNFFAAFPQNIEMLFTLGLLLQDDSLAKWYHWLLGALAVAAVGALSRRLSGSRNSSDTAWCGAALFATVPSVTLLLGWAYVDLGVVFFATMSTLLFLHAWQGRRLEGGTAPHEVRRLPLYLAALLAGLAAGCKYTAGGQGLIIVGTLVFLGVLRRWPWRVVTSRVVVFSLIVLACVLPWYLKNIVSTGNPFYPFAYSLFGGDGWDTERAAVLNHFLGEWGGSRSGWNLLALPWDVSLFGRFCTPSHFDGIIGCAFLMGAPFVVYGVRLGERFRITLFILLLHGLLWLATTHQVRFLLPAIAVLSALTAVAIASVTNDWARRSAWGLLSVAMVLNVSLELKHFASHNPLPVVLGLESRDEYLARELAGNDYSVFRYIEEQLPPSSRILFGSCGNPGFLCKRPYYADALFENHTLALLLRESDELPDLDRRLRDAGFTHLLFRFENVFDPSGRRSEIPLEDQELLASFLNQYARLECEAAGTCLYALQRANSPAGRVR